MQNSDDLITEENPQWIRPIANYRRKQALDLADNITE
jgi:hypothetical protein